MDDFLKWVLRLSKPDLAAALIGIPAGAAVDVWLFPGGLLDPFNTGLYFSAAAVGVKYAAESFLQLLRNRKPTATAANKKPRTVDPAASAAVALGKHQIESLFIAAVAALDTLDGRHPRDREICQNCKSKLEERHRLWQEGQVSDGQMYGDVVWATERYWDVTNARRSFEQQGEGGPAAQS